MEPTKELTIASIFCSAGVGMDGYVRGGFTPVYAADKEKEPLEIFDANFRYSDGSSVIHRKDAKLLTGKEVLDAVEEKTGSRIVHCMEQGPSCQDYTEVNTGEDQGRRELMLDAARLISEVQPLVAVIEESDKFLADKHKDISGPYFDFAKKMNYNSAYMVMNTIHYESNQSRTRFIHIFVREDLNVNPVFPEPMLDKVKRVKDFLDIDYFFSGHFSDKIKTKNHFMCTVTSGSPLWFSKGDKKWPPTDEEKMICMDLDPKTFKLASNATARNQAWGNGIPASLTYHLSRTIIDKVLRMERDANSGLWLPKK